MRILIGSMTLAVLLMPSCRCPCPVSDGPVPEVTYSYAVEGRDAIVSVGVGENVAGSPVIRLTVEVFGLIPDQDARLLEVRFSSGTRLPWQAPTIHVHPAPEITDLEVRTTLMTRKGLEHRTFVAHESYSVDTCRVSHATFPMWIEHRAGITPVHPGVEPPAGFVDFDRAQEFQAHVGGTPGNPDPDASVTSPPGLDDVYQLDLQGCRLVGPTYGHKAEYVWMYLVSGTPSEWSCEDPWPGEVHPFHEKTVGNRIPENLDGFDATYMQFDGEPAFVLAIVRELFLGVPSYRAHLGEELTAEWGSTPRPYRFTECDEVSTRPPP